jgi:hypothetical protein
MTVPIRRPLAIAILVTLSMPALLIVVRECRPGAVLLAIALLIVAAWDWLRP